MLTCCSGILWPCGFSVLQRLWKHMASCTAEQVTSRLMFFCSVCVKRQAMAACWGLGPTMVVCKMIQHPA